MKIVDVLLDHCRARVNKGTDNAQLSTTIKELIESGCDVNAADEMKATPLHVAISYSLSDIAHELIEAGADINLQGSLLQGTPLHYAVKFKNVELVCMLLCYGADVNVLHRHHMTPFMFALDINTPEITEILFDYYDDFSYENVDGYNALLLAVKKRNPLATAILKAGANVNCYTSPDLNVLSLSLIYEDAELFKLVWPKFNHKILLNGSMPFLLTYLRGCCFPTSQWLECLYLILESPAAFDLIWNYLESDHSVVKSTFFSNLIVAFYKRAIEPEDRLTIIYICLSLGAEACFDDIICAYKFYGFADELVAFIYVGNHQAKLVKYSGKNLLLPTIILALETNYNEEVVYQSLKDQILYGYDLPEIAHNSILNMTKFFSLPRSSKKQLMKFCKVRSTNQGDSNQIARSIEAMAEIPSLIELCRDQARILVKQSCNIEKPYQFYDALRNNGWPPLIRDIVCFKKPIYK